MVKLTHRSVVILSLVISAILAGLIVAILYYYRMRIQGPDASGLMLVNAAWTGGWLR